LAYWPIEEDPKGIFNGLAAHPEYQRIVSAYRNKYADARERIVAEAPYLLDPALPYYIDTPGLGVAILPTSNESSFPVFDNYAKNYRLELYTRLSEMPGLRVPSPEAVDHALETSEDLAAAVDQLGVSHAFRLVVLPNDADSVRDSLSLLDPRKDEVVWEIGNERLVEQWTEEANERLAWLAHAHERSFAQALRAALYEREQEILGEGDTLVLNAH
ncbi:MAG: hypothetical protein R3200_06575, partial [Xanthomonadales bacterium]|nr:hypothetical protein [Xanthomonadales bacterium]